VEFRCLVLKYEAGHKLYGFFSGSFLKPILG
jgi:hypothetical protein